MSADSRFVALPTSKMLEVFAWQDAGMSFEAAMAKVEGAEAARAVESAQRVQEAEGSSAYEALFGPGSAAEPAGALVREATPAGPSDPYEALFGRGAR